MKFLIIFFSFFVLSCQYLESCEEDSYCQYHGHSYSCRFHRHTNHCDHNQHAKLFDYSCSSISEESESSGDSSVKPLHYVLDKLEKKIIHCKQFHYHNNIEINLSSNYIKDNGFEEIFNFITKNKFLRKRLVKLDISNNKITKESLSRLSDLVEDLSKIKIDISNNRISRNDFNQYVSDKKIRERIKFNVY